MLGRHLKILVSITNTTDICRFNAKRIVTRGSWRIKASRTLLFLVLAMP